MLERIKGIIFVTILGIIFPSIAMNLFGEVDHGTEKGNINVVEKTEETRIAVMMDNGEICQMSLNDYLTSVVLCEMPADFEFEALKAQAVVARTYALRRNSGKSKHEGAAVCTQSSCCQGYLAVDTYISKGGTQASVDKIQNAVLDTENIVLTYDGELIDATYFSCSGGMTEDAAAVWGEEVPYLQATVSPGEENAAHYKETVKFTLTEFSEALSVSEEELRIRGIESITYTAGGGVDTIRVCQQEFKGTEIREKLKLKSTAFVISVVGNTVTITTKGFGHRVGMSQYGADAMAVEGSTYDEILKHYYQGVEVTNYDTH